MECSMVPLNTCNDSGHGDDHVDYAGKQHRVTLMDMLTDFEEHWSRFH